MREAIHKLTAPLLAWIPDISGIPPRTQAAIGAVSSVLFHVLLLLLLALWSLLFPKGCALAERVERGAVAQKKEIELEIVPMNKPELRTTPPEEERMRMIDAHGLQASQKPAEAKFESDRDMVAGSEAPPTGLLPLPSQQGRDDFPAPSFADQDVVIGAVQAENGPPAPAQDAASPQFQQSTASVALSPMYTPQPVSKPDLAAAAKAKPDQQLPEPAKIARATPPPLKTVPEPREDSIPISKPQDMPEQRLSAVTRLEPPAAPAPPAPVVPPQPRRPYVLATPAPLPVPNPRKQYLESERKTLVEGAITNRGRAGVDSVATPMGRYWAQVKTAIGSVWTQLAQERMSLIAPGTVTSSFIIGRDGKVRNIHIESNTSNHSFGEMCEEAIRKAPIPPPPREIIPSLRDGELDYPLSFTFYNL